MSRSLVIAIVLLIIIVVGVVALAGKDSSVPLTRIEKPVDANAAAR